MQPARLSPAIAIAVALPLSPVAKAAENQVLPQFSDLAPVVATDASRLANELNLLIQVANQAEQQANYWRDACRSTPECGGAGADAKLSQSQPKP
jgi:hypothetical protein